MGIKRIFHWGLGLGMGAFKNIIGRDNFIEHHNLWNQEQKEMVPDPATFCSLPWVPETGWMLCDIFFDNGTPVPFSPRQLLRRSLEKLVGQRFEYVAVLEAEFNIFKLENPNLGLD